MDPKPSSSRPWRTTLIVIAEILVSTAMWCAVFSVIQRSRTINPFFDWRILGVLAVTFSQLLVLGVITALWDSKRSVRWLLIIAILLAESASLCSMMVITNRNFRVSELWTSLSQLGTIGLLQFLASLAMILGFLLTVGVVAVLLLHVLLWPARNMLGWRVHWVGERVPPVKPQFTIWHLLVWTALIGVLLSLGRTLAEFDSLNGMTTFLLLWGLATLLSGSSVIFLATRQSRFLLWLAAVAAWLVLLSWAESELTLIITRFSGTGNWLPLWLMMLWNGIVAIAVVLQVLLLRWLGIVFDLRLPFAKADNGRTVGCVEASLRAADAPE